MKKIGITGGIGAGKSVVCKVLEVMGYPVYYSDQEAKNLMVSDTNIKSKLDHLFQGRAYKNGELNRDFIAGEIFSNPDLKNKMNQIIHPAVRSHFESWSKSQNAPIVFNEAAILFETGAYKNFDATILVVAPREMRMDRVKLRDKSSEDEIAQRMENQWPDEKKIPLADFVLHNDGQHSVLDELEHILTALKD